LWKTASLTVENPIQQLFVLSDRELKSFIDAVRRGADAMMSPEDCKKRSAECLSAAQLCGEDHGQQAWRQLSALWVAWSDTLDVLSERERLASLRGMRSPFSY
jgi:hypothetical protein